MPKLQLCMSFEEVNAVGYPVLVEPKYDGVRAYYKEGNFYSRADKPLYNLAHIKLPEGYVFDGELLDIDWNSTISSVHTQINGNGDGVIFNVFDMLTEDEWNAQDCDRPQIHRSALLRKVLSLHNYPNILIVPMKACQDLGAVTVELVKYLKQGYEGIVIKNPFAPYAFRRHRSWLKLKPHKTQEFEVIDIQEGTGKYVGMLGALIIKVGNNTCGLGTGFTDEQRRELWANPPIGKKVEVQYQELTVEGVLRFPSFKRVRVDV